MKQFKILNLGAGVQSTALYLLACDGALPADVAIFADTGEEPEEVYAHLEWLRSLKGVPILVVSKGGRRLGDDLMQGKNSHGGRFASIPAFTLRPDGDAGVTRRQCSKEYKIEVIQRSIRESIVGLKRGERFPKSVSIVQYIGISLDEAGRARRIEANIAKHGPRWAHPRFPLIEKGVTRADCVRYLAGRVPHETPRSACVFCPYHDDGDWLRIRQNPRDWARAVEIDEGLRREGAVFNRNLDQQLFLHRSCKPLVQIDFSAKEPAKPQAHQLGMNFQGECLGVCGI